MTPEPRFPGIRIDLEEIDGNIFVIGGRVGAAMRRYYHQPSSVIDQFYAELNAAQSYSAALDVVGRWTTLVGRDDED